MTQAVPFETPFAIRVPQPGNRHDGDYINYLGRVQRRFLEAVARGQLFMTDAGPKLWEAYLSAYAPEVRQYHNCNACRRFVERFGALVTINADGTIEPAVFSAADANPGDEMALLAVEALVRRAKVVGPFISSETPTWGRRSPVLGPTCS